MRKINQIYNEIERFVNKFASYYSDNDEFEIYLSFRFLRDKIATVNDRQPQVNFRYVLEVFDISTNFIWSNIFVYKFYMLQILIDH